MGRLLRPCVGAFSNLRAPYYFLLQRHMWLRRFDEQHSAAAVRMRAVKIREIAGAQAVLHTPLVLR